MTEQQAVNKLLDWWRKQLGYHEGENNWNKYAENADLAKLYGWKPQNQPWCDTIYDVGMIECFGLKAASEMTYQPIGKGSALCKKSAQYYKDNKAWFTSPQPGDQVFFYDSAKSIEHTGVVEKVYSGKVECMEGNKSDQTGRYVYAIGSSVIAGYGRPKWSVVAENATSDDGKLPDVIVSDEPSTAIVIDKSTTDTLALPLLRKGDKGEVVRAAQYLLNGRGASVGKYGADGDFGPATQAAVLAFQRRNGLTADGIIGAQTWAKLLGVN